MSDGPEQQVIISRHWTLYPEFAFQEECIRFGKSSKIKNTCCSIGMFFVASFHSAHLITSYCCLQDIEGVC